VESGVRLDYESEKAMRRRERRWGEVGCLRIPQKERIGRSPFSSAVMWFGRGVHQDTSDQIKLGKLKLSAKSPRNILEWEDEVGRHKSKHQNRLMVGNDEQRKVPRPARRDLSGGPGKERAQRLERVWGSTNTDGVCSSGRNRMETD